LTSFWLQEPSEPIRSLKLDGAPEVAIVGGGVTGCACALTLALGGKRVRLYEAREIAGGASGRNGGFALRGAAIGYLEARRRLGRERTIDLWRFSEAALDELSELAGDALERTGSLKLAADEAELEDVRAEYEALREDDFDVEWRADLPFPLAGRYAGALFHPGDGALQPARWVRRLAGLAADAGAELREHERVESLDELDAEHVVVATDGYTRGLVSQVDAAIRPTRGQVLTTEPLPTRLFSCPHYARRGFDYWQQLADRRLVLGGRRDSNLEGEFTADETMTNGIQNQLDAFMRELVGFAPRVTHRWAGLFGMTEDRLPLVGRVGSRENVWVAAGYSGHGNVLGFACGKLVAGAILGDSNPIVELFDPARTSA
jgi:gamma-glutamylputrescine oxidase